MDILAAIWTVTYGVLLVILGFNALILVHEFGHFAVARLCGVRCEKFYLFFDFWGLRLCRFKWGNTEYGIGLFPLGGYVKMLGQEDDPGAIRAEIERAKQQEENNPTEQQLSIFAPDSYLSKSVPQRLAIIVAGVLMNLLFAVVCAAGAYMIGVKELEPRVGNVIPGSPAWEAGLQSGDEIAAIDGKPAGAFGDVTKTMISGNKTVTLDIERQSERITVNVSTRKRTGDLHPNIGIISPSTLELASDSKKNIVRPLWEKHYSAETLAVLKKLAEIQPLRIEKVDGQDVTNYIEYQDAQLAKIGLPIKCTFNGTVAEIPAIPMRTIPVRFKMGTITSVLSGSDAAEKGIVPGDTIVSVDDDTEFDPLKLPQILLRKVNEGQKSVRLALTKASGEEQTLAIELKPVRILPELASMSMRDPLGSTALGLSWNVEPVIAAVEEYAVPPGQFVPAVGDKVTSVEFVNSERLLDKTSFSGVVKGSGFFVHSIGSKIDIPYIFADLLQDAAPPKPKKGEQEKALSVGLTLECADGTMRLVELPIRESDDWFHTERGFGLKMAQKTTQAAGIGDALVRGTAATVDFSLLVYKSLNALINGTVSTRALNGPVGIVTYMYQIAQGGWSVYFLFLCLIGANLAVINLLPIPPLDGGHVLFLLYEGIFRRPPNELIQVILSYFGLFLIILLMIWTLSLDLTCIPRW